MPRLARIAPDEHIYHVLTRGNNRQDVFKEEKDYNRYIEKKTEKGTVLFNEKKD